MDQTLTTSPSTRQPIVIQVVGNGNAGSCVQDVSYYNKRRAAILGSLHIFFGVLSIALSAAAIHTAGYFTLHYFSWGFLTPVSWFIAGGFGLGTACVRNNCMITTFMTASIISAFSMTWYLTLAGFELASTVDYLSDDSKEYRDDHVKKVSFDGVVIAVGVCEGLVSIFSAILCCSAVCCGASNTTVNAHTIEQIRQIINQAETSQGATAQTLQTKGLDNITLQVEPPTAPSYDNDHPPPYQDSNKDSTSRL